MQKLAAKYARRKRYCDTDPMACCNWKANFSMCPVMETCWDPWQRAVFRSVVEAARMAIARFWREKQKK